MKNKRKISFAAALCLLSSALSVPSAWAEEATPSIMKTVTVGTHEAYYMYDFSTKENMLAVLTDRAEDDLGRAEYAFDSMNTEFSAVTDSEGKVSSDTALVLKNVEGESELTVSFGTALDASKHNYVKLLYKFDAAAENVKGYVNYNAANSQDFTPVTDGTWNTASVNVVSDLTAASLYLGATSDDTETQNDIKVKYVAMFNTEAEAEAFDPSVVSATIGGAAATVDPFNHTVTVEETTAVLKSEIAKLKASDVALTLYSGAQVTEGASEISYTNDKATAQIAFNVTDITGKKVAWTVKKITPIKQTYKMIDFTQLPLEDKEGKYTGTQALTANNNSLGYCTAYYDGPTLLLHGNNNNHAQLGFDFGTVEANKQYYLKLLACPGGLKASTTDNNALWAMWWTSDGYSNDTNVRKVKDSITYIPLEKASSVLESYTGKFSNFVTNVCGKSTHPTDGKVWVLAHGMTSGNSYIKYAALFESKEEADLYDPTVESATIKGEEAVIDPFAHTAMVSYPEGTKADAMKGLTEDDISMVLFNHRAEKHNSKAELISEEKVKETNEAVTVYMTYKMTDVAGEEIIWKVGRTAPRKASDADHFVLMFDSQNEYEEAANEEIITAGGDTTRIQYRPVEYSGPAADIRSTWVGGTEEDRKNEYNESEYKFADADPTKDYYAKVLWRIESGFRWRGENDGTNRVQVGLYWTNNWPREEGREYQLSYNRDEAPNLGQAKWVDNVFKVAKSTNSANLTNKQLTMLIYASASVSVKYVGLFETKEQAEAYDPSVKSAILMGQKGDVDPFNHTVTFEMGDVNDVKLSLLHSEAKVPVTAEKLGDVQTINGQQVQKYTVTTMTGEEVVWSVRVGEEAAPTISVSAAGNKAAATYANAVGKGKKVIALYDKDGANLIDVAVSDDDTTAEISGIEAGEYKVKAFLWDTFNGIKPLANNVEQTITVTAQ